jgi:cation transport ATPase
MAADAEHAKDDDHPLDPDLPGEEWNAKARDESDQERLDRNFNELLQELRVAQAGVQILFAFLLSLAFTQRFEDLTDIQRGIYVVALVAAAVAAALFIAPVSWHRMLFRMRRKHELVHAGNRFAVAGLGALVTSVAAAFLLIVDVVIGPVAAVILTVAVAGCYLLFWYVLPLMSRMRGPGR